MIAFSHCDNFFCMGLNIDESSNLSLQTSVQDLVKDLVGQTSGFMPRDLCALIADAGANIISKMEKLEPENSTPGSCEPSSVEDSSNKINDASQDLSKENIFKALERSKKRNASALGTPKVNNLGFNTDF